MSIIHTVVFTLQHDLESKETADFLKTARTLTSIQGVENFEVRKQTSAKSDFQFGLSMVFQGQQAYDHYNNHPTHVDFVENRWLKEVTQFQELDFVVINE